MKNLFALLAIAFILSSCRTNLVFMTVREPAPVTVPPYIKKAGIINRSLLSNENKVQHVLDNVLGAKGPELDIEGGKESIRGVKDALMQNSRFDAVTFLDTINLKSSLAGAFPSPLSWETIERICRENNVDALFALELFDTDSKISYTTSPTTIKSPIGGVEIPATMHHANMETMVKTGWRIYDPRNRAILDEFPISSSLNFSGSGVNPMAAAASLLSRKEAVKQAGYKVGQSYAYRIVPFSVRVSRDYYIRGSGNFKMATRMARTGNWDRAAELWKKETTNKNYKIQGRACYNMAIINEINGDLETAISWAQKSYETSGKHMALDYLKILKNRRYRDNRLKSQTEGQ
ncbi:MAG: hypothetical protein HY840_01420 [Bacteroidetes bacterium]|nr:hypothetical protein [Bacteroidota bacterium]